jgi:hypothetical protein
MRIIGAIIAGGSPAAVMELEALEAGGKTQCQAISACKFSV